ncbi:hypothetical protein KP509_30G019600 [Ceratopteris richardii]|nr:hypothetical protein KP509_30G019600 [Ceratopteris richardii]KAH7289810.1 hypothetical protein KP509_30G019600 [Ceratopteris richardii]
MIETVLMKLGAGGEVTTNELVKVFNHMWNLEERHSHTMSVISAMRAQVEEARAQLKDLLQKESTHSKEVEHVTKQIIEERALWKQQQEIHIQQAVRSIKEELDAVRKSKRKLEALYKGSIKELQDARKKMDKALKEIRKERRARELMEGICDELARKVGKDKAKVEELKRESLKVREEVEEERKMLQMAEVWREERVQMKLMEAKLELEEKNNAVNKLQSELEMLINAENKCDVKEEAAVSQYTYRHSLDLYSGQSFADIHQPHDKKSTDSVGNISGKGSSGGIEVGISDGEDDLHSIELKPSRDKLVQQYSMETNDSGCSANQPLHNKLSTEKPQQMARIDQDERKTRQDMKTRKKKFSRQSRVSQWIECNFKEGEMEWGAREHHVEEHLAREESSRLWQNIHESSVDPVCSPKGSKQVVGHEVGNLKPAWMKSSTLCEKIGDMFPQNKSDLHHDTFGFPDIQSHIVHGNQLKFFDMVPSPAHQWNHHWLPSSDVGTMSLRASMENSFQRKLFETKLEGQQQPWKMQC